MSIVNELDFQTALIIVDNGPEEMMELEVSGIPLVDDALKEIENDESF